MDNASDAVALFCPWCNGDTPAPVDRPRHACALCGHDIDLTAQFLFLRARSAYAGAAEPPAPRSKTQTRQRQDDEVEYYGQAYTALQEALQGELAPAQRREAISMMAHISRQFAARLMTSPLEASYWAKHAEYERLKGECHATSTQIEAWPTAGLGSAIRRWLWRARLRRLTAGAQRLRREIRQLEQSIEFTYMRSTE